MPLVRAGRYILPPVLARFQLLEFGTIDINLVQKPLPVAHSGNHVATFANSENSCSYNFDPVTQYLVNVSSIVISTIPIQGPYAHQMVKWSPDPRRGGTLLGLSLIHI